jgi:hypothetical protein
VAGRLVSNSGHGANISEHHVMVPYEVVEQVLKALDTHGSHEQREAAAELRDCIPVGMRRIMRNRVRLVDEE